MISNTTEQEFPLNNPETLEQMRQQLISLVQQDQEALYNNLRDFKNYQNQHQQSTHHYNQASQSSILVPIDFFNQNRFNLKEKSNCITTLAQLSVRLIDCILDEQQNNVSILQQYQRQVQILKEQIDCLASKNQFIQNDAEYFKQHLQNVESQLENMVSEQMVDDVQENLEELNEKDRQIGMLQEELQRIKNELQFYKFSTRSKKSSLQLKEHLLLSIRSQNTLLSSSNIPSLGNLNEIEYQNTIQKLENENENLKRELQLSRRSRVSNRISNQIKEEDFQETQRIPNSYEFNQYRQNITKVSSVRFFEKGMLHNFREYLQSPRSKFDEENNVNTTPVSQLVEVVKSQTLNQEWSTKSFDLVSDLKPAQLIYLNQEEEQYLFQKKIAQFDIGKIIQQTRETQGSVRGLQSTANKYVRQTHSIGVNTDFNDIAEEEPQKITFIQRLKQIQFPLMEQISNFFIRNRIRKNVFKANQSMLLINS